MKKNQAENNLLLRKKCVFSGHVGAIYDVAFYNGFLLTSSADQFVAQWDVNTGKQTDFAIKLERSSYNFAISPEHNLLAIGANNGDIHLVDLTLKKETKVCRYHTSSIFALTYDSHNHFFYSGDKEGNFCVWKDKTFELMLTFPYDCGKIREIAINEDGSYIALCCQDGYVRILDTCFFNLKQKFKANEDGVNCAVFDGGKIYTGGKDAFIYLWNWEAKKKIKSIPAHNFAVYDMAFLHQGKLIVSVSFDKSIKLWKARDLSILGRIEKKDGGHQHTVNRIAVIDENTFATVGDDRKVIIWEIAK